MPNVRRPTNQPREHLPLWAVLDSEQDTSYVMDPGASPDWLVHYETRSGVRGTLRVPSELYSPEYVAEQLTNLASVHEQIVHLKHDGQLAR